MRTVRYWALLSAFAVCLAACGPGQPATPTAAPTAPSNPGAAAPTAPGTPAATSVPSGNLRLMGWSSSPEEDRLLNDTLTDFSKQYPSIQVTFQPVPDYATKLQTDLAAGTAADVFYVDSLLAPDLMKRI